MGQTYTTTDLIASIKRRGMVPTSQSTFQTSDFLTMATEEIQIGMMPFLMKIREEFYLTYADVPLVANQALYAIPTRAIGNALRDVVYSADNTLTDRSLLQSLPRLEIDQIPWQSAGARGGSDYMFAVQDNSIRLVPAPTQATGNLRLWYHRRPSDLIQVSAAAKITAINSTTQVVVGSVPSTFLTSETFDVIKGLPSFDFHNTDKTLATIAGTTLTFSSAFNSDVAVGDYVALAGESPIPQIPRELQPVLAQRVVVQMLEALGDREGKMSAESKLSELEDNVMNIVKPRVIGEPRKIVAPNYFKNSYHSGRN